MDCTFLPTSTMPVRDWYILWSSWQTKYNISIASLLCAAFWLVMSCIFQYLAPFPGTHAHQVPAHDSNACTRLVHLCMNKHGQVGRRIWRSTLYLMHHYALHFGMLCILFSNILGRFLAAFSGALQCKASRLSRANKTCILFLTAGCLVLIRQAFYFLHRLPVF